MRLELTTSTLATSEQRDVTNANAGLTAGETPACTNACTSQGQNGHETPAEGQGDGPRDAQGGANPLEALAKAIADLSAEDRAKLAAILGATPTAGQGEGANG